MITAVLFDAGQVLYERPRRAEIIGDYLVGLGLSDELDAATHGAALELKKASWLGRISPDDYHRGMLELHGVSKPDDLDRGAALWSSVWPDIVLFPGVRETLRELRDRGLLLGVVTNTLNRTEEKLGWFRARGMSDDLWAVFATSCELGLVKPDPEIYRYALSRLAVPAAEVAFVGHAQHELDGAAGVGMATIAYNRDDERVTADIVIESFPELLRVVDRSRAEGLIVPTIPSQGAQGIA